MFRSIITFLTALLGIGGNVAGVNSFQAAAVTPIPNAEIRSCYIPEPDVYFTVKYPENFQDLTDSRVALNPKIFSSFPATFNTDTGGSLCKDTVMTTYQGQFMPQRTYIRVKENLRVPSCKVDELAGPYSLDGSQCTDVQINAAKVMRGTCAINIYPDLRKIGEVNAGGGSVMELFWTPFTHNVGCDFDPEHPNCGTGQNDWLNLKDFLYVLTDRDAFEQGDPADCKVRWDERSRHNNPCSHYFDVYMALDTYQKIRSLPADVSPESPDYRYYMLKQKMDNCREQYSFTPVVYPLGMNFPPEYISKPFTAMNINSPGEGKIVTSDNEFYNYCRFTQKEGQVVSNMSLYKIDEHEIGDELLPSFDICPQTPVPFQSTCDGVVSNYPEGFERPDCYARMGTIDLQDQEDKKYYPFAVFGSYRQPGNFYLKDVSGADPMVYIYVPTNANLPANWSYSPSLQLSNLEFQIANQWSFFTPVCKPAVYLYPEKQTDLNVKLDVEGKLTVSDPEYDAKKGWNITANPDGEINIQHPTSDIRHYPYLYYEADIKGVNIPKEGWVVEKFNIKNQITNIMSDIGFIDKEISDFLSYWLPRLNDKPYYFITLLPEESINQKEKLVFSETPDTLIRTRFVFEGLDLPVSVVPLSYRKYQRNGFTVTDWGGTLIGKSCEDVSVK